MDASLAAERPSRSRDRKSTRLNSSHDQISYAVFCLKKKKNTSELQSRSDIVCRLLLEKKKKGNCTHHMRSPRMLSPPRHTKTSYTHATHSRAQSNA